MNTVQVQTITATPSVGPGTKDGGTETMEEDIHSRENIMGGSEMIDWAGHSTEIDMMSSEEGRVQDEIIPEQLFCS